jgi:ATP-dependent helicase/nuclease subunit B
LRDNCGVHVRFVLGPAGTGKTCLCLEEIRRALLENPEGPPLILLAPKQATFQLERQLLDSALPGYTRLRILSFERLAQFVFDQLRRPRQPLLSEEGRAMVFRALLGRRAGQLRIFHSNATLIGFARQLSAELRELQQLGLSPEALEKLAARAELSQSLRAKLLDLALLLCDYLDWLDEHNLQDDASLFDLAAEALCAARASEDGPSFVISHLWLDGFAEMTPQELTLLAEVARCCQTMTLAFCIDAGRDPFDDSWLSIWSGIKRTRGQCGSKLHEVPGATFETVVLRRDNRRGRFVENPTLRYLEENWAGPGHSPASPTDPPPAPVDSPAPGPSPVAAPVADGAALRMAVCPNFHAEAVLAAGEILRFVRGSNGGRRFRDVAVLLRNLEGGGDELRRVFTRYQIPFFLDRRESVAHHPLAELTRNALRLLAWDWQHDDWFSALKTGLVSADEEAIDRLENEALAHGWNGQTWQRPFSNQAATTPDAEALRRKWVAPFLQLTESLSSGAGRARPTGAQLAGALRRLWADLGAQETLQSWSNNQGSSRLKEGQSQSRLHGTVWEQMNVWLDDVALAFGRESLPLAEWLPILEAGLGGLTVGVIPPALDQVLIGTVDRSRNPDLKLALVLGVNETIFPSTSTQGRLLSEADRDQLIQCNIPLGLSARQFLSREHFLGYIACTRARQRLVVTFARQDAAGHALNPSLFVSHLQRLLPSLEIEEFSGPDWTSPDHACEVMPLAAKLLLLPGAGGPDWNELLALPAFASAVGRVQSFQRMQDAQKLSPQLAEQLYGPALRTSVSALEQFAACSFRFFVHAGLRAEERKLFELESREKGTFQHEVLAAFHQQLQRENTAWHDLTPESARARIATTAENLTPHFAGGLLVADPRSRFAARMMTDSLKDCVATMVEWMKQYNFEPRAVELGFGRESGLPAWELDLGAGHRLVFRGRIDRIDLCPLRDTPDAARAVVIDYKSTSQKLDDLLMDYGLQLQLPAYLGVLQHLSGPEEIFGVRRLVPAGVFYVNLRGHFPRGDTRDEVLQTAIEARHQAYKHLGRFDVAALPDLDNRDSAQGTQFNFKKNNDGRLDARNADPMPSQAFRQLLEATEQQLRRIGREVFAGNIELNPYQHGAKRPCATCQFQGICRIDPWTHSFRVLKRRAPEQPAKSP